MYECNTSWYGESFISGWEIGSKIWKHYPIGFISLWATGFSLLNYPKQVLKGYKAGLKCRGVIDLDISKKDILQLSTKEVREKITKQQPTKFNWLIFIFWCLMSQIVFLFPLLILVLFFYKLILFI